MLPVFSITLFVSAALLFVIQPLFAKMVLPLLGGTPAVWNTCMVFFQAALLAGYGYAHVTTKRFGARRQSALHLVVLLLPLLALPIAVRGREFLSADSNPTWALLLVVALSVGMPFLVVAATNPMLQAWLSASGHPAAKDPYFLYAASNAGSMIGLLGYPLVLEPLFPLAEQSRLWSIGYGVLFVLLAMCAFLLWRAQGSEPETSEIEVAPHPDLLSGKRRMRWLALAFVPSSLLLGVTTYLTTDVASFPLLWVIPLAIYLLTFILVFARRALIPRGLLRLALPWVVLPLALSMASIPDIWLLLLHLLGFFVLSMVCHGELAADRPHPAHLTEFYFWMSLGGVLGGAFNALVAPVIFNSVLEYPLAIVVGCLLCPAALAEPNPDRSHALERNLPPFLLQFFLPSEGRARRLDFILPMWLAAGVVFLGWFVLATGIQNEAAKSLIAIGLPAIVCFGFKERPVRFGLGIAAVFLGGPFQPYLRDNVLLTRRSFFGVHRVYYDQADGKTLLYDRHRLLHGTTSHGYQNLDESVRCVPLSYYHPTGPVGEVFKRFGKREASKRVALVGLGTGSLAAYCLPGQEFTFYEIDRVVKSISENPAYFTYLSGCVNGNYEIVLGDARQTLAQAPDGHYGIFVLDAFSSDAIPLHLVTREALALYLTKLAPGGVLAFHISNRYLALESVLGNLAADAGLACITRFDSAKGSQEELEGKLSSRYVVMSRSQEELAPFLAEARWTKVAPDPRFKVWTDDYSNVLSVLELHSPFRTSAP